jgi:hypothetical protein
VKIAAYVIFAVLTLGMFVTVGRLYSALGRRGEFRVTPPLILMGFWEMSVGGVILATHNGWSLAFTVLMFGIVVVVAALILPRLGKRLDR